MAQLNWSNKSIIATLHFLVWAMLFILPYYLTGSDPDPFFLKNTWVSLALFGIAFYANYFFLIDRFFFGNSRTIWFFLLNVLLVVVLTYIKISLKNDPGPPPGERMRELRKPPINFFIYIDLLTFLVPIVFSVALKSLEKWKKVEEKNKEAEKERLESELIQLKYQLQPHFFFNALNNIYALVDINPETAKSTIHNLGKLMRYLLYETNSTYVALQQEVSFMQTYIALMRQRFSKSMQITFSLPKHLNHSKVAPLLFVTLMENAFKHGVSSEAVANIDFSLEITATELIFSAINNYYPKDEQDKSGSGIGLQNLRKRLNLIYGEKYSLENYLKENRYHAILTLPITAS